MKAVLYNYEIYPLAFPVGKQVTLTVKPLGDHAAFSGEYRVLIHRVDAGNPNMALYSRNKTEYAVTPDADGCLRMDYTAEAECQHFVRIYQGEKQLAELSVYALEPDLACRRPFRGDLHIQTSELKLRPGQVRFPAGLPPSSGSLKACCLAVPICVNVRHYYMPLRLKMQGV